MQKKCKKKPGTTPMPGPKVFFTTIFTLKITLSPGTGTVPGFFEFFLHFLPCPYIFWDFWKKFGGQPTLLLNILSSKILFKWHLLLGYGVVINWKLGRILGHLAGYAQEQKINSAWLYTLHSCDKNALFILFVKMV